MRSRPTLRIGQFRWPTDGVRAPSAIVCGSTSLATMPAFADRAGGVVGHGRFRAEDGEPCRSDLRKPSIRPERESAAADRRHHVRAGRRQAVGQFHAQRTVSRDHPRIVVGARHVGVGVDVAQLVDALGAGFGARIDELDEAAVGADRVDLDARRVVRHHDDAGLAGHGAGAGERLAEVAGRGGENHPLRHVLGDAERRAEFEAAGELERFNREDDADAEAPGQVRRFVEQGRFRPGDAARWGGARWGGAGLRVAALCALAGVAGRFRRFRHRHPSQHRRSRRGRVLAEAYATRCVREPCSTFRTLARGVRPSVRFVRETPVCRTDTTWKLLESLPRYRVVCKNPVNNCTRGKALRDGRRISEEWSGGQAFDLS